MLFLASKRALAVFVTVVSMLVMLNAVYMLNQDSAVEPDDTWQRIQEQQVMTVGVDIGFAPFGIYDPNGPVGIDPDIAHAIGEQWGVEVRFQLVNYDGMYDSLLVGDVDMVIAAVRPEPRRAAATRYTSPYFDGGQVLISTQANATLDDVNGDVLGIIFASDGDVWARNYLVENPDTFVLQRYDDSTQLLTAMTNGEIEFGLLDRLSALETQQQHPNLSVAAETILADPLVIVVRRSDWKLYDELQKVLRELDADGILDTIILRWL